MKKSKDGKAYHRKEGLIRLIKRNNSLKEETGLFACGLGRIIKAIWLVFPNTQTA